MTQGIIEDRLFVLYKYPVPAASDRGIGDPVVDVNNCTDGVEANNAPNLLSVCTSNICSEDMVKLRSQEIHVDDDNNTAPCNVPRLVETTADTSTLEERGYYFPP